MGEVSEKLAREIGPVIENMTSLFPNRTNVQLLQVLDRNNIKIEIWGARRGLTRSPRQLVERGGVSRAQTRALRRRHHGPHGGRGPFYKNLARLLHYDERPRYQSRRLRNEPLRALAKRSDKNVGKTPFPARLPKRARFFCACPIAAGYCIVVSLCI